MKFDRPSATESPRPIVATLEALSLKEKTTRIFQLEALPSCSSRERVVFPIHDEHGGVVGHGRYSPFKGTYHYQPEEVGRTRLYNLHRVLREHPSDGIVLADSPLAVWRLRQIGFSNTLAMHPEARVHELVRPLLLASGISRKILLLLPEGEPRESLRQRVQESAYVRAKYPRTASIADLGSRDLALFVGT